MQSICDPAVDQGLDAPQPAYRLAGVDPAQAVFSSGKVWLDARLRTLPRQLRPLFEPVRCVGTAPRTLSGTTDGADVPSAGAGYGSWAPYSFALVADHGPDLGLGLYTAVRVRIQVTAATQNGEDPQLERQALTSSHRVAADVKCDGGRFVATSLQLQ